MSDRARGRSGRAERALSLLVLVVLSGLALSVLACNAVDPPLPPLPGSAEDRRLVGRLVAVTSNLKPDASCGFTAENMLSLPSGLYDLAQGSEQCNHPYRMHLQVMRINASAPVAGPPDVLQLHTAEVRLTTLLRSTLQFGDPQRLPNPFTATIDTPLPPVSGSEPATAIAVVDAIPFSYAAELSDFVGERILAEVRLFGTTLSHVDVAFAPFVYPIEICDRCLTLCASGLQLQGLTLEDLAGGECADNAGADGRICVDDGC